MGQVPRYLLIGDGRVARHFQHYFSLLHLPYTSWSRKESLNNLQNHLPSCSHILLLIADGAIEEFTKKHLQHTQAHRIHFSGSLISEHVYGAHPLMTFGNSLYDLHQYQAIPFVIDQHAPSFTTLLPGLSNPHVRLNSELKPKYHALCVLSGNFSCLLWQKFFTSLEQEFHIPSSLAYPYLLQQMQNLVLNPEQALTGPLSRGDTSTIEKNIIALELDPFQAVYKSFVSSYSKN